MYRKFHYLIFAVLGLLTFSLSSCEGTLPEDGEFRVSVRMSGDQLTAGAGSVWVSVIATGEWTLALEPKDGSELWCALGQYAGNGSKANIMFSYEANDAEASRSVDIVLVSKNGKMESHLTVVQMAKGGSSTGPDNPDPDKPDNPGTPDKVTAWLELPAMGNNPDFYTHSQTLGGKSIRSWSYLWDYDALVAHWVAYPLNAWTIGSGSRTNEWGLDPKIPRGSQPVLYSGFKGGYDRGHQCPSADRLNYAANVTTFYGTNMTPQLGSLNQKTWANLEGQVRDWAKSFDTLYVVTGCTVAGSTKYAYDNDGKAVKVPTGYYKALLGYKKNKTVGITATTGGYTGIGFYFDHSGYSGDYMNMAMTIDALEAKVGEDFFVNLKDKIGSELADRVESTKDSYWY
ncbi:MAG: DNA/RNA non-specific endonuclease [Bacteroidales bacterium]|nr:DNA/RNA non-specific endonuclease [Bacteroidales bacterium]